MSEFETYSFTAEIQKKIFAMLLFDKDAFMSNIEMVKPEFFDSQALKDFAKIILDYKNKKGKDGRGYGKAPAKDEFQEEVLTLVALNKRLPEKEYLDAMLEVFDIGKKGDFDYVRDKVADFARFQGVKKAILDAGKTELKKRNYEGIVSQIRTAVNIGETEEDLGTFIYGDSEKLKQRLDDRESKFDRSVRGIRTGFANIDRHLNGGICPQEVGVIMGPLKRGKTTVAANFAKGALIGRESGGCDVVHYSFESNRHSTQETYDAMFSGIPRDELMNRRDEVERCHEDFFNRPGVGQLIIKHFPANSSSVFMLESHLYKLKAIGIEPKLLIIDYLSLMRPLDKTQRWEGSAGGRYLLLGQITLEIINLAQRKDIAIWLLHQAKGGVKSKYEKKGRIGTDDAADSQEIMRHTDVILTLNQTKEETDADQPQLVIYAAGGRSVEDNWEVKMNFYKNQAQIREI